MREYPGTNRTIGITTTDRRILSLSKDAVVNTEATMPTANASSKSTSEMQAPDRALE
jgi:hypothetical protein